MNVATTMYLSRMELCALTDAKTRAVVTRVLRQNRWPFIVGADGWPRVLRSYHDDRMNGRETAAPMPMAEPNWSAMNDRQEKAVSRTAPRRARAGAQA